jgi:hypothetical protein
MLFAAKADVFIAGGSAGVPPPGGALAIKFLQPSLQSQGGDPSLLFRCQGDLLLRGVRQALME